MDTDSEEDSRKIGEGAFGVVFVDETNDHAIKMPRKDYCSDFREHLNYITVAKFASKGDHFLQHIFLPNGGIRMKLCEGSLRNMLHEATKERCSHFCVEVAETIAYLHRQGLVHGDIKPDNFVVSGDRLHLIDLSSIKTTTSQCWNRQYLAVDETTFWYLHTNEVQNSLTTTTWSDVASLAMVVFEIMTKEPFCPAKSGKNKEHLRRFQSGVAFLETMIANNNQSLQIMRNLKAIYDALAWVPTRRGTADDFLNKICATDTAPADSSPSLDAAPSTPSLDAAPSSPSSDAAPSADAPSLDAPSPAPSSDAASPDALSSDAAPRPKTSDMASPSHYFDMVLELPNTSAAPIGVPESFMLQQLNEMRHNCISDEHYSYVCDYVKALTDIRQIDWFNTIEIQLLIKMLIWYFSKHPVELDSTDMRVSIISCFHMVSELSPERLNLDLIVEVTHGVHFRDRPMLHKMITVCDVNRRCVQIYRQLNQGARVSLWHMSVPYLNLITLARNEHATVLLSTVYMQFSIQNPDILWLWIRCCECVNETSPQQLRMLIHASECLRESLLLMNKHVLSVLLNQKRMQFADDTCDWFYKCACIISDLCSLNPA